MKEQTAIVGIGWTKYTKESGKTPLALALEASRNAIEDSGLAVKDIDGVVSYSLQDSVSTSLVATSLGLPILRYSQDESAGGGVACSVVSNAAMAVASGMANNVLVFRAMNGSSGLRYSRGDRTALRSGTGVGSDAETQFLAPYGATVASHYYALITRRHMFKYGTTPQQLGAVAITSRKHACLNERAMMRSPLTMEKYESSPIFFDPLRLLDCCLMTDGACALIATASERARDLRHPPVYIMAAAQGTGPYGQGLWSNYWTDHTESAAKYIGPDLFGRAGITPKDINVAELYDAFTITVIIQLEDFGFCEKGEGGPYVQGGRIEIGGKMPVNTHGGLLSEAYINGLNSVVEGVSQLRGEAGKRQVRNAEIGLVAAAGGTIPGSALILRR